MLFFTVAGGAHAYLSGFSVNRQLIDNLIRD